MDEDYNMVYGIDKLAELLIERGIEFYVNDGASLFFMDGSGNPHECWMAGAEENLVNVMIVVTPEQALSVPDLNGVISENAKLRKLCKDMLFQLCFQRRPQTVAESVKLGHEMYELEVRAADLGIKVPYEHE